MTGLAVAVAFVWLGMVLAISFLEAPLKFRAPGVTLPIGLGIGRLVFRALNAIEILWAAVLLVAVLMTPPGTAALVAVAVVVGALVVQLAAVRPRLTRRSDAVLAGPDATRSAPDGSLDEPRSHAHLAYVALEVVKVLALLVAGVVLLTTG